MLAFFPETMSESRGTFASRKRGILWYNIYCLEKVVETRHVTNRSLQGRQVRVVLCAALAVFACAPAANAEAEDPPSPECVASMPGREALRRPRPAPQYLHAGSGRVAARGTAVGPRELQWERLNVEPLIEEDRQYRGLPGVPERIGVNRPLPGGPVAAETAGLWTTLEDGRRLWFLRLVVPEARAVRVHFDRFDLPDSARLLVAGPVDAPADVYTAQGPLGTGHFWSAPVSGPVVHIEYEAPADEASMPAIRIDEISHIYRAPFASAGVEETTDGSLPMNGTEPPLECHEDVNCHAVDPVARDAVGAMVFTVSSNTYVCTGALLNDADPNTYAGYFLTANHCLSSQAVVDTLTVYWFYQTDTCDGTVPDLQTLPKTLGGTLLANSAVNDFSFLRLADDPSDGQTLAGWTTNGSVDDVSLIHHPQGTHKRVSFGTSTIASPLCGCCPLSNYWYVRLHLGTAETGSSGAPLFNANSQVVGQLYGSCLLYWYTVPDCDNYEEYNLMFGKFSVSYPFFADYLNAITPDDMYEPNDTLGEAAGLEPGAYTLQLVDFDDYFAVMVPIDGEVSATADYDPAEMDLNLELLAQDGTLLDESRLGTGTESVSATVTRGTYIVRALRKHGWGGGYTFDLTAPRFRGDFDLDGDVDMEDFTHLQLCLTGPVTEQDDPNCFNALLDDDLDTDRQDVTLFLECANGPFILPPPECGP